MDCSKSDGESYRKFNVAFNQMSSLERKWFLRYWLRTPRNGINEGLVRKLVAKVYDKKEAEVKKHMQLHSLAELLIYYQRGEEPPNDLKVGRFISPMLAKAVPKEKWPKEHIIEYKYDGARYQIHKGDSVLIFNRKGKVVTDKFPDIVLMINTWEMEESFIIDTEIYPVESDGKPAPFKKMGTRIHSKNIVEAIEKCPVNLGVFDCMMFNDENLMDNSLRERLPFILKFPKQAVRTTVTEDDDVFYNLAINEGFEGIMVKDLNTVYESGKRSKGWAKYKPPRIELDVVVTGARYGDGKRATVFGSYDIAVKEGNEFIPVGSIGTGFSDIDLISLTQQGKKIIQRVENGTYELLPRIVLEVTADLVTRDANDNLGLRFPRLLRIRSDKPVSDINTLRDVEGMI
jgi:DNA ligase-1